MSPKDWGPAKWIKTHQLAKYSDLRKNDLVMYVYGLRNELPCEECRLEYSKLLEEFPLRGDHLKDNRTAFEWTVFIHNQVNKRLGKPMFTYDAAWAMY